MGAVKVGAVKMGAAAVSASTTGAFTGAIEGAVAGAVAVAGAAGDCLSGGGADGLARGSKGFMRASRARAELSASCTTAGEAARAAAATATGGGGCGGMSTGNTALLLGGCGASEAVAGSDGGASCRLFCRWALARALSVGSLTTAGEPAWETACTVDGEW